MIIFLSFFIKNPIAISNFFQITENVVSNDWQKFKYINSIAWKFEINNIFEINKYLYFCCLMDQYIIFLSLGNLELAEIRYD